MSLFKDLTPRKTFLVKTKIIQIYIGYTLFEKSQILFCSLMEI
jgi:hypothetical protein